MLKYLKKFSLTERLIWSISVVTIIVCFFAFKNTEYLYLVGSLIGITALIFVSKGNPIGQLLCVIFGIFYAIISYTFQYYGEMITYLGMSVPIAVWALISWLKNPYMGDKSEVKVNSISKKEWCLFLIATAAVTVGFYFILRLFNTANLIISTISVFTSFSAVYLTARRSRFYAIGYALNDAVLIVMWILASIEDISYVPMVVCFAAFLVLDGYGFINWSRINKRQKQCIENDIKSDENTCSELVSADSDGDIVDCELKSVQSYDDIVDSKSPFAQSVDECVDSNRH